VTASERVPWTTDFLDWHPWVETLDEAGVTPELREAADRILQKRVGSPYYEVLANDLESVRTRTALFSDIFESDGGAPRADRELAATATSRVNGCVYCASVHARLFVNLTKQRALTLRFLDEGIETELPERERAIVDFSDKLTRDPESVVPGDFDALRTAGFDDLALQDVVQGAAIFANANRLMLTLGEPRRKATVTAS
jgi:uncharacterized peroxidase-related enzyme